VHEGAGLYTASLPDRPNSYRISALDAALKYIRKPKNIWLAIGSEIARYYRATERQRATPKQSAPRSRAVFGSLRLGAG
jgi:hypothetical protein